MVLAQAKPQKGESAELSGIVPKVGSREMENLVTYAYVTGSAKKAPWRYFTFTYCTVLLHCISFTSIAIDSCYSYSGASLIINIVLVKLFVPHIPIRVNLNMRPSMTGRSLGENLQLNARMSYMSLLMCHKLCKT